MDSKQVSITQKTVILRKGLYKMLFALNNKRKANTKTRTNMKHRSIGMECTI